MAACAGVGQVIFDDWVDWVLRGHGMVKKLRTFNHLNGEVSVTMPDTLHCTRLLKSKTLTGLNFLPSELRFGAVGSAAGYTEFDPLVSFDDILTELLWRSLWIM